MTTRLPELTPPPILHQKRQHKGPFHVLLYYEHKKMRVEHLGDGAYITQDEYGGYILTANHHDPVIATDVVYLEPSVMENLIRFTNGKIRGLQMISGTTMNIDNFADDLRSAKEEITLQDLTQEQWERVCNRICNCLNKQGFVKNDNWDDFMIRAGCRKEREVA